VALAGKNITITDVRAMTMPQIETYIALLTGKTSAPGRHIVPARRGKGR
jgi:hypothetical protein